MSDEYSWSVDGEYYHGQHPTREAALAEALDGSDPRTVWTGRNVPCGPASAYARGLASQVIESVQEAAFDVVGDACDEWLDDVTPEVEADLGERLAAVFESWATEHGLQPQFGRVVDVQEHTPTAPEGAGASDG